MRSKSGAGSAVPIYQIENARRYLGFIKNFCEQICGKSCKFTRLQDHRASCSECWSYLAGYLIHGPVPRSDEAADPDRLLSHERRAFGFLKVKTSERPGSFGKVRQPGGDLGLSTKRDRGTHL